MAARIFGAPQPLAYGGHGSLAQIDDIFWKPTGAAETDNDDPKIRNDLLRLTGETHELPVLITHQHGLHDSARQEWPAANGGGQPRPGHHNRGFRVDHG